MKFYFQDLKYLVGFTVPWAAFAGIYFGGFRSWLVPIVAFGIIPLLELVLPSSDKNFKEEEEASRIQIKYFDWLLYLNVPIQFGILFYYLYKVSFVELPLIDLIGMTISVGICCGVLGINVAHELGHRKEAFDRICSKLLLMSSLYMHFIIEHNRGHHKNVSSPLDPASADLGETLYLFYFKTIIGSFRSAWNLEKLRLERIEKPVYSLQNEMICFMIFQLLFASGIFGIFGWKGLLAFISVAFIGILLLETVNYVEHYGLRRREIAPGVYEKVKPTHSWNSDHALGRIMLYELTRHSDHHYKAQRKFQILRHFDQSPQLPTGYPGSMIMAVFPPLWFYVMNKRVRSIQHQELQVETNQQ